MTRARWSGAAATLLVVLAGAWLYGSPYLTLWEIGRAVEARDVRGFSAHIDFAAVRDNAVRQLAESLRTHKELPLAQFAREVARSEGGSMSAEGFRASLADAMARAPAANGKSAFDDAEVTRDSLWQFSVVSRRPGASALVFRLEGLTWMLVDVRPDPRPCRAPYCGIS